MCTPQESDIIIHTWIAEVDMLVGLFRAPGGVEQIFRTGSYQGRLFFTVDEPHVIAFTIPHGGRALYIIIQSHKMALSLDIGKHIIVGSVLILRLLTHGTPLGLPLGKRFGNLTVEPRMETPHALGQFLHLHIVYVVVEGADVDIRLILYLNARTFGKRHGEIAAQTRTTVGTGRKGKRSIVILFVPSLAEKGTDGGHDRRFVAAVPVHPKDDVVTGKLARSRTSLSRYG